MNEANGIDNNFLDFSQRQEQTPLSEIENIDVGRSVDTAFGSSLSSELELVDSFAGNIDRLDLAEVESDSELELFGGTVSSSLALTADSKLSEAVNSFASNVKVLGDSGSGYTDSFDLVEDGKAISYTIKAEGKVKFKGQGDFDGETPIAEDDALVYAGSGFEIKGQPVLPVQRDEAGNALLNDSNQQLLVDGAVNVSESADDSKIPRSLIRRYSGLAQPQIVETQAVEVPDYEALVESQYESAIGDNSNLADVPANTRLNNPRRWSDNFPAPGTLDNPTVVTVKRNGLTIPSGVDLDNYIIIVERGNVKFNGGEHNLNNVTIIAEQGKIELNRVNSTDSNFLAAKSIKVKNRSVFSGDSLIANAEGKIEINSYNLGKQAASNLKVVAASDLKIKSTSEFNGEFVTGGDFIAQGPMSIYGSVAAKGDVELVGRVKVFAVTDDTPEVEPPIATVDDVTVTEASGIASITVSLDAPSNESVSVDYAIANDTAVAGSDYQAVSGTVTFNPGETSKTIQVELIEDAINESDETFFVQLTNPNGLTLSNDSAVVTITDDDKLPELTVNQPSFSELDSESGTASFTISLDNPSSRSVTVDYVTVDDTAVAGTDYEAVSGTITFEPGETSKTVVVPIKSDSLYETDESFSLTVENPSFATIATDSAVATIVNDDPLPELAVNSVVVTESSGMVASFEATLSEPSGVTVTVDFMAEAGTATEGDDFTTVSGTLTFEPGETSKTIAAIPIIEDSLDEIDEMFTVKLSNPSNAEVVAGSGTVTIEDNDDPPELSVGNVTVTEGDESNTSATFEVTLSQASGKEITVDYATEDGSSEDGESAIASADYIAQTDTLAFEPGQISQTVEVEIVADKLAEAEESFSLSLSNPTNATIDDEEGTGIARIIDTDLAPLALDLNLANDTGTDNSDRLTNDITVVGAVENNGGDVSLSASVNNGEVIDLSDLVREDGSFTLGLEQLRQINGAELSDGTYTLELTATNSQTEESVSSELVFTLDTTAPTLELTTPLADGDHSSSARLQGRNMEEDFASLTYSLNGVQIGAVAVDENGRFDAPLDESGLTSGVHLVEATATDLAGNQSTTEVSFRVGGRFTTPEGTSGWGALNESTVILGEQDSYVVQTEVPIKLGLEKDQGSKLVGTRTISFNLDTVWDQSDGKAIEDQLLVYLVDSSNPSQTLLGNGAAGTAVFSLAGEKADFTPGLVSFDGNTVTIDASSLTDVSEGLLVFQLLNQDDDTGSVVTVNNVASTTDPEGFVNPVFPQDNNPVAAGAALDLNNLTVATEVQTIVENVRFNADTGEYRASISVMNDGDGELSRNTAIIFNNLPDGVELIKPSGTDGSGNPYINLRPAIASGGLNTGAVSDAVEVVFTNPNLARFSLDTTVLAGNGNVAPIFEPIENLTIVPGQKLELNLAATDANGDNVTYKLTDDSELPTGMLSGNGTLKFNPQPDEIGSYEFTVIATDGVEEVSQTITVDVIADPITTTRISGVIENVNQEPLVGVPIELGELSTVTNADGSFTIESDQPITADTLIIRGEEIEGSEVYPYIAEKLPLVLGQELFAGFDNVIDRPIYLPALDVASGQVIDPSENITVTTENIPGASVFVEAGSLSTQSGEAFTGTLSITEVPTELTPAVLPDNLSPDMVVTIQPGEMVFETPAPLTFPNRAGYEPGTEMDLWSINPETGDFDKVGEMVVSEDGSIIETVEGGIVNSSWHFPAPPPPPPRPPADDDRNEDNRCPECSASGGFNSEVEFHSGAVVETHNLTSYSSNGSERGITLNYDSLRANPSPIIHFGYDNITPFNANSKVIADLTIKGEGFDYQVPGFAGGKYGLDGGEHIWSVPRDTGNLSVGLQADLQDLPSGLYNYTLNSGLYTFGNEVFTGSSSAQSGDLVHVNTVDSIFGSGWGIAGWQELIENVDGSVLLINGDGNEMLFEVQPDGKEGYISPPGDFSTLEKLPKGFRRTTKDKMVYLFNDNNQLQSVTDPNGNRTSYIYGESQELTKIVDAVGLETKFTYNDAGKVARIIDPDEKATELEYDEFGNLIQITDPDGTTRSWSYDSKKLMVGETDQKGSEEQAFYDQSGRAKNATLKDGSSVKINPLQSQGVFSQEATINPLSAPEALIESPDQKSLASYVDGKGNTRAIELDRAGQEISSSDGAGDRGRVERNEDNLIVSSLDAKGNLTEYTYDERGNVLTITDSITVANNAGGNALIVNGELASSEPELSAAATENINSLLSESGFDTTIVEEIPTDISQYEQIWDLRFDSSAAINESQAGQYLDFLQTGGNLFLLGENSVFAERNDSIINLIAEAGGGELEFALTSPNQQVQPPFDAPNPVTDNLLFQAPGGVINAGTGQFITVDEENRGAAIAFTEGSLSNATAGELTTVFDLNLFVDTENNLALQNLLDNLTKVENTTTLQSYTYDPVFNQVTSHTDELGNLTLNDIDPDNGNILSTTRVIDEVGGTDDLVTIYTYTDAGLVATMTDPEGRVTGYEYDDLGRLIAETEALGTADAATMRYELDGAGNRTAVIDPNGNRTEYEYDEQNRVVRVTEADPDGDGELTSPVSTFVYDEIGNLLETIDGNGNKTEHQYDDLNRRTLTINSLGEETGYEYDSAGNMVAAIDGEGRRRENVYDSRNRLVESIDSLGNKTQYQYDFNDNLIAVTDSLGNTTRNFYDSRERLFRTIDAEGNVTNVEHDEADNIAAITDAEGNRTEFEYDDLNRQVKQTNALGDESSIVYDKVGNVVAATDEEGRTTQLDYDNRDRLVSTTNALGDEVRFEYDSVGNLIATTDEENRTTRFVYDDLNRTTEVIDPLGQKTVSTYDAVDNVLSVTDANEHTTSFTYDDLNRPSVVTNAVGDTITTDYDAVGNVIAVTDELGRITTFDYDERNLQTSITDPLGYTYTTDYDAVGNVAAVTDARGNKTRYEYDKLYRLIATIDANNERMTYGYDGVGNLLGITDELNRTTSFSYDALNRQVSVIDPLLNRTVSSYDGVGNLVSVTDANEHTTSFTYDSLNRQTVVTNALGDMLATEYDKVGNAIAFTNELGRTTEFGYDSLNRNTSITDALDNLTSFGYDPVGNLLTFTDANEHTTGYEYDELNRQIGATNAVGDTFITSYDEVGNVTSVTDELGRTTSFVYDERNLQTGVTNALGNTTTTEYDSVGNVIAITDALDNTTSFTYDALNREIVSTNALGDTVETDFDAVDNVTAITDELGRTTEFGYDERNLQTSVTDPLGYITSSTYDPAGNLLTITDANNHTTSFEYDELNRQIARADHLNQTSSLVYDKVGNLIASTDELDRTTNFTYDALNRTLTVKDPENQTTTNTYDPVGNLLTVSDPLNLITSFGYDSLNRNTSVTNPGSETTSYTYDSVGNQLSITDPENNTTSYTYDDLNRTLSDTNQLGLTRSYTYDEVGNVVQTSDRNGREISFTYDALYRNSSEIWLDGAGEPIRTFEFNFDAASQLTNANDPDSKYSFDYDLDGRVTSVDNAGTPGVPNVVFDYTYDPVDNLTQVEDSIDGEAAGVENFTYDELDRVTSVTQSGNGVSDKRVDFSYDAASQMQNVTRYSDLNATELVAESIYTFDGAGRLTDLVHEQNAETLAEFGLVYDKGDRITRFTTPDGVSDFTYDDSDQLTSADYENQADESYSYDDNGNRTNDGYVTGDNNQLTSDGTYNYEYDNEGNRTKQINIATGEVTKYEWDYRNRLVAAVTEDELGNVIANSEYTYDVFDRRIGKSVDADGDGTRNPQIERYVLDGDHIALTFNGEGDRTERFLHGLGIDQVLAQENADGEVLWALTDHQNSVRVVLDSDGNIVNQISYDSFGGVVSQTNANIDFRFGYTGRELDDETGLHYYRARYYDSAVGRFISEDPIGFAAGDSNIYRYVGNNPLFYLDPSGFCGVGSSGGGAGGDGSPGGEPEYFGPGFGPGYTPGASGDGSSNSDGDNGSDFWRNASEFVFGEPASAGELPDSALVPPGNTDRDRRVGDRDRRSTEREIWWREQQERFERGLEETQEFIRDVYDRNIGNDIQRQLQNPEGTIEPFIDPFIDTDGDRGEFDPNNINRDGERSGESQLDISDNTGDFSPRDFLEADQYEFPDGVEDLFTPYNPINIDDAWEQFENEDRDPVPDAVEHILRDHPERLDELGVKDAQELGDLLDRIYNDRSSQVWERPDGSKAYVDTETNTIFIDNPNGDSTAFPNQNPSDYLNTDGFKPSF